MMAFGAADLQSIGVAATAGAEAAEDVAAGVARS